MFAYCNNNPANYVDSSGREPIMISVSIVVLGVVVLSLLVDLGAKTIYSLLQWISTQWQYAHVRISFVAEEAETDVPDVTYPGDNPEEAPDGYEWKGKGKQGSKGGNYYNEQTGESLHPDLNHPEGIDPHWDYNYRGSRVKGWRIFRDGKIELKK